MHGVMLCAVVCVEKNHLFQVLVGDTCIYSTLLVSITVLVRLNIYSCMLTLDFRLHSMLLPQALSESNSLLRSCTQKFIVTSDFVTV